jgi:hypothetical protein
MFVRARSKKTRGLIDELLPEAGLGNRDSRLTRTVEWKSVKTLLFENSQALERDLCRLTHLLIPAILDIGKKGNSGTRENPVPDRGTSVSLSNKLPLVSERRRIEVIPV